MALDEEVLPFFIDVVVTPPPVTAVDVEVIQPPSPVVIEVEAGIPGAVGPPGPEGPPGIQGPAGPQGIQGSQGVAGTGITMLGSLAVEGDLPPSGNTQGDAWIVQADDSLWIWDGDEWVSGGSIQGPPGSQGPTGPQGATGATGPASTVPGPQGPQGEPGISAGRIFYYDATTASDITGYKRMLESPSPNAESTIAVACTGVNVDFPIEEFATNAGVPGAVDYPAGTAFRRIYAKVNSGTARLHLQVYGRTGGGVETLVRDEYSPEFSDQTVALQEWLASSSVAGALAATDRIVNKLYAQRITGGGGTVTVTTYFEGTSHGSHIQTTISAGGVGPAGPPGADGSPDTAAQILAKLVTVDGTGSGLDADLVDGHSITVSSTAPSSPGVGDIWIDTS